MKPIAYRRPVDSLHTGCSLGNPFAFARLDAKSDVCGVWGSLENQYYVGEWNLECFQNSSSITPTETVFHAESQSTLYRGIGCNIEKTFLIPFANIDAPGLSPESMQVALFSVTVSSEDKPVDLLLRHRIIFPALASTLFTKQPAADQCAKRVDCQCRPRSCDVTTIGNPDEARVFGAAIDWDRVMADNRMLEVEYSVHQSAHESREYRFALGFSPTGVEVARASCVRMLELDGLNDAGGTAMAEYLERSFMFTPDSVINRGLQWAKVNTVRVQHRYRTGWGFTNDPPQDIVVIRDLAWYALGADYLTPEFSRGLFALADAYVFHEGGKLTEYIHADEVPSVKHDYGLNINDDTPLFVIGLHHFLQIVADSEDRRRLYPLMSRACEWILHEMVDDLVWCHADGTSVWGICGWRNIIEGYNLSGAVTEVNAECCRALEVTAEIGAETGRLEDATRFLGAARKIRQGINTRLVSSKTGMYLLNISNDGILHHDVTGDLIYPVLLGMADEAMKQKILARLTSEEMWTSYGSRTVSEAEANFDPDAGYQLLGGLWTNLTAWIAYCLRDVNPEKLVEGMHNIFRLPEEERPVDWGNVVPGEFPERLHGTTAKSRGMTMSPWLPPTYFWLGIEGLFGFTPDLHRPSVNPSMPNGWTWMAVSNLFWQGQKYSFLVHEGELYANCEVDSTLVVHEVSFLSVTVEEGDVFALAFMEGDVAVLFAGADVPAEAVLSIVCGQRTYRHTVSLKHGECSLIRFVPNEV